MRDIRANGEMRALIGAEKLRELHGDARCGLATGSIAAPGGR